MTVKKNNKVTIEYEGRFNNKDGEIFDSSKGKQPLTFVTGLGMVVSGFDNAIIGMEKGEEKEINLMEEEAYGPYREDLKQKVPRNVLPKEQTPEVGMMMIMSTPQGQQIPAKITEVDKENITLDVNHPLAGRPLYFKIKLVDYEEVNPEDLMKSEHTCECNCSDDDACKKGEEECKCETKDSKESSIEDLAEGK